MRPSLLLDIAVVLAFATVGRASHAEGVSALGVVEVAWPFAVGLSVGWLATAAVNATVLSTPWRSLRAGTIIWLAAVPTGMTLRALTGQGTDPAFVLVATGTLGLGLLGWRMLARWRLQRA